MPYAFTPPIKPFVIASLFNSLRNTKPSQRQASTLYSIGNQVINNNVRYICSQGGVTGAGGGPSGTSGIISDGTVRWLAIAPELSQEGDLTSNLYVGIGKQTEWADPGEPDEPEDNYDGEIDALNNATAFIRVDSNNLRMGIQNNVWTTATVYSQYDPSISQLDYPTPHYCVVNSTQIYKCLDNKNGAASTVAPSGTSATPIETADGYIWKYVGSIAFSEQFDFATTQFCPAPANSGVTVNGEISTFDDISIAATPFAVSDTITVTVVGDGTSASAAVRTVTAGSDKSITSIYATNGGSGYTSAHAIAKLSTAVGSGATATIALDAGEVDAIAVTAGGSAYDTATVIILGDGTGAEATANIVANQVVSVTVDDPGADYTWAEVFIIPGTKGAVAKAVLSPINGHGSNLLTELNASTLLISTKLTPALNNYIPTEPNVADGTFRQVSLVGGIMSDEGSDRNAVAYLGKAHPEYETSEDLNKYKENSGYVLYINNISAITHTSSQEEVIKISISL